MRMKSEKHLAFIRTLPCVVCHDNTSTEAAHIRMADAKFAKPITGNSIKPDDCYVLPLCSKHHRLQHQIGEREFWSAIDPIPLALALYAHSGDFLRAQTIINMMALAD